MSLLKSLLLIAFFATTLVAATPQEELKTALEKDLATLTGWQQVHVAETLIAIGEGGKAREVFLALEEAGPYPGTEQVGVWRVLAQSAASPEERQQWVGHIAALFLKPGESRRLHAIESLGKLGAAPSDVVDAAKAYAREVPPENALFAYWVIYLSGDETALVPVIAGLSSETPTAQIRSALILQFLKLKRPDTQAALERALEKARARADRSYPYLLSAAYALDERPPAEREERREEIMRLITGDVAPRELAQALVTQGEAGRDENSAVITRLLPPLLQKDDYPHRCAAALLLFGNAAVYQPER